MGAAGFTAALAAVFVFGFAGPAGALPILEPGDADELAQALAEATEEQDICYGWEVLVEDYGSGAGGTDAGSSLGVDMLPSEPVCARSIVFEARIVYTSESSEAADSATMSVRSDPPGMVSTADIRRTGVSEGALLGNDDDLVLANAVLALPALAAEGGFAPPVTLEANEAPLPAGDGATGTPGSDWLRKYGGALGAAALVAVGGAAWAAWILATEHPFRRRKFSRLR
ncbi:MAG: hypothetical protein ACRDZ3_08865 [Acidimicrobiia bacterium]